MVSPTFRRELKGVVRLAVIEAGGQEACAVVSTRIRRHAAFSDYANPETDDRHLPIDVAVEIDAHNGNARIIGALARQIGHVVVRAPDTGLAPCDVTGLVQLIGAHPAAVGGLAAARADGVLTPDEVRQVRALLNAEIIACLELDRRLAAIEGGDE